MKLIKFNKLYMFHFVGCLVLSCMLNRIHIGCVALVIPSSVMSSSLHWYLPIELCICLRACVWTASVSEFHSYWILLQVDVECSTTHHSQPMELYKYLNITLWLFRIRSYWMWSSWIMKFYELMESDGIWNERILVHLIITFVCVCMFIRFI